MLREYQLPNAAGKKVKPVIGDIVMDMAGNKYQVKAVGSKYCIATRLTNNEEVHIKLSEVLFN